MEEYKITIKGKGTEKEILASLMEVVKILKFKSMNSYDDPNIKCKMTKVGA